MKIFRYILVITLMLMAVSVPATEKKAQDDAAPKEKPKVTPAKELSDLPNIPRSKSFEEATRKFKERYDKLFGQFSEKLKGLREQAAKSVNVDEVRQIDIALRRQRIPNLTTPSGKSLVKLYTIALKKICQQYASDLDKSVKADLVSGRSGSARQTKVITDEFKSLFGSSRPYSKTVRVEADKDWQAAEISVTQGTEIALRCTGKWGPGHKERVGPKHFEYVEKDADTYKLQVKIGKEQLVKGGTEWKVKAKASGSVFFRMAPVGGVGPRQRGVGKLTVRMSLTPADPSIRMQQLAFHLVSSLPDSKPEMIAAPKSAKAPEKLEARKESPVPEVGLPKNVVPSENVRGTLKLTGEDGWKNTGVAVRKGQKVMVELVIPADSKRRIEKAFRKRGKENASLIEVRIAKSSPVSIADKQVIDVPDNGRVRVKLTPFGLKVTKASMQQTNTPFEVKLVVQ